MPPGSASEEPTERGSRLQAEARPPRARGRRLQARAARAAERSESDRALSVRLDVEETVGERRRSRPGSLPSRSRRSASAGTDRCARRSLLALERAAERRLRARRSTRCASSIGEVARHHRGAGRRACAGPRCGSGAGGCRTTRPPRAVSSTFAMRSSSRSPPRREARSSERRPPSRLPRAGSRADQRRDRGSIHGNSCPAHREQRRDARRGGRGVGQRRAPPSARSAPGASLRADPRAGRTERRVRRAPPPRRSRCPGPGSRATRRRQPPHRLDRDEQRRAEYERSLDHGAERLRLAVRRRDGPHPAAGATMTLMVRTDAAITFTPRLRPRPPGAPSEPV